MATAASGLRARLESLDLLANNLANASTAGYKSDRESYGLYVSEEASSDTLPSTQPVIAREWTDFSSGVVRPTGNPLDVAIEGRGFFAVDGPQGPLYTRNGAFQLLTDGRLANAEGYPVRSVGARAIRLDTQNPFEIQVDGTVQQDGQTVGRLEVVDFTDSQALVKQHGTCFRAATAPQPATGARVGQGKLEGSNAAGAESAVRLIGVMRQFEMLQKAITLGGDMSRRALEEVAKVGA